MLSLLTPAFNESTNLEPLYGRVLESMRRIGVDWEWLIVDDHSRDDTFAVISRLAGDDHRVRGIRLARNSGSHVAIACGLHHVRGDAAVMMAADLQDPPETIGMMLDRHRAGAHVVWAVRRQHPGTSSQAGFAALYYWIMRRVVGMAEMPARGADFFLVDRLVVDAFRRLPERNMSVLALVTWLGFRQEYVEYDKQPRASGRSGWTLRRKIDLVIDSVTAFSPAPIRACSYLGVLLVLAGTAVGVVAWASSAAPIAALTGVIIGIAGVQLVAAGILGEYVWRALDESRRRPAYFIEAVAGTAHPAADVSGDTRGGRRALQ